MCNSFGDNSPAADMSQSIRVSAPGKIILHGEHSVVYGKKAIAVSVGLLSTVTVISDQMDEFHIQFDEIGTNSTFSLDTIRELKAQLRPDFKYETLTENEQIPIWEDVQCVLEKFSNDQFTFDKIDASLSGVQKVAAQAVLFLYLAIFDDPFAIRIRVETDLPIGAGLGSSASFGVALAGAVLLAAGKVSSEDLPKDLINRWAFVVEKFIHGTPSGVDNTVCTFGSGVIFQRGKDVELISEFPDIRVLLVNTRVPRSTKLLVLKVASLKETHLNLFQTSIDGIDEIVELAIKKITDEKLICPNLISKNHEYLKILGVSHPSLETIVELAQQHGFASKLTGAGGGGCIFIFIPKNSSEESIESLKGALEKSEFEFWDTKLGCPGVLIC